MGEGSLEKLLQKKSGSFLCATGITLIYFALLYLWRRPLLALNDDMMLESIFSGAFLEAYPYSYYVSAELGGFLSGLYRIIPAVPWLGLFYTFGAMFCVGAVLAQILGETEYTAIKRFGFALLALTGVSALYFRWFFLMHYTVLAALYGAAGLYLFVKAGKSRNYCLPIVMFLFSYLIRENVFFMLCPFILAAAVFLLLEDKGRHLKKDLISGICFVTLFCVLFLINRLSMNSAQWKDYLNYNETRTNVYDYLGVMTDEDAYDYYRDKNVSKEEIEIIASYNLALLQEENGGYDALTAVENLGKERKNSQNPGLFALFKVYVHRFLLQKEDAPWNWFAVAMYALLALVFIGSKNLLMFLPLGLLGVFRSILWMILLERGRYPERVTLSLYLLEIAVLLGLFSELMKGLEIKNKALKYMGLGILMLFFAATSIVAVQKTSREYAGNETVNRVDDQLYEYMREHPENFYFLEVYSTVYRTKEAWRSEGDSRNNGQNYVWMGGWMIRHPLYLKKLDGLLSGAQNAMDILLEKENAFLVMKEGAGLSASQMEEVLGQKLRLVLELPAGDEKFAFYKIDK